MEKKVLTEEEITALRELNDKNKDLINSIGRIEYQITLLQNQKDQYKEQILSLDKESINWGKILTEKYGSGQINLETGEIVLD